MQPSGIESAIQELQRDVKKVQEAIAMLRRIQKERVARGVAIVRKRRKLTAKAKRRISEAAKRRWAAARASLGNAGKKIRG